MLIVAPGQFSSSNIQQAEDNLISSMVRITVFVANFNLNPDVKNTVLG